MIFIAQHTQDTHRVDTAACSARVTEFGVSQGARWEWDEARWNPHETWENPIGNPWEFWLNQSMDRW